MEIERAEKAGKEWWGNMGLRDWLRSSTVGKDTRNPLRMTCYGYSRNKRRVVAVPNCQDTVGEPTARIEDIVLNNHQFH